MRYAEDMPAELGCDPLAEMEQVSVRAIHAVQNNGPASQIPGKVPDLAKFLIYFFFIFSGNFGTFTDLRQLSETSRNSDKMLKNLGEKSRF